MVNFDEIFERIKQSTNTRTQMELAEVLDIRQSSISDAKRRNSVPAEWYMKLFERFGLNPAWLKGGTGPKYLRSELGYAVLDDPAAPLALQENAAQYNEPEAKSAVVPVYSALDPYTPERRAASVGRLNIPLSYAQPEVYVIRIESASMEPFFRRGAYVGIDTARKGVVSGELFAINLPYEGVVLKRIYIDAPRNNMILRSENPSHPELVLPVSEQDSIVGRVSWVLQKL